MKRVAVRRRGSLRGRSRHPHNRALPPLGNQLITLRTSYPARRSPTRFARAYRARSAARTSAAGTAASTGRLPGYRQPDTAKGADRMSQQARDHLGRFGIWRGERQITPELAATIEDLGFGTLWLGSASGDLAAAEEFLAATTTLIVATGIVNMWQYEAARGRRVVPPGRGALSGTVPAGRGRGPPRGGPAVRQALRHARPLRRHPAGRRRPGGQPGPGRARPEGAAAGRRAYRRRPSLPGDSRATPGRPGRSWARARCWPRSRRWSSAPTPSRRAR